MKSLIILIFSALFINNCQNKIPREKADVIYFGDPILTMEDSPPQVEAVAIKDGKILFVGKRSDTDRYTDPTTRMIDLKGNVYYPVLSMSMDILLQEQG